MNKYSEIEDLARDYGWEVRRPIELVTMLEKMLLVRCGLELTPEIANERARNIATALAGSVVTT